ACDPPKTRHSCHRFIWRPTIGLRLSLDNERDSTACSDGLDADLPMTRQRPSSEPSTAAITSEDIEKEGKCHEFLMKDHKKVESISQYGGV
ncbi:unnamed protein product, partial [Medioppia subpectinata]